MHVNAFDGLFLNKTSRLALALEQRTWYVWIKCYWALYAIFNNHKQFVFHIYILMNCLHGQCNIVALMTMWLISSPNKWAKYLFIKHKITLGMEEFPFKGNIDYCPTSISLLPFLLCFYHYSNYGLHCMKFTLMPFSLYLTKYAFLFEIIRQAWIFWILRLFGKH